MGTGKRSLIPILTLILAIKAVAAFMLILYAGVGLAPDEAQYWTWSQQLDWGYYSKPPGIGWQIALGSYFFGNTELAVRSMSLLLSLCLPLAIYSLSHTTKQQGEVSFWAAIVLACSPIGILSSFAATTDAPFILCWILSCLLFLKQWPSSSLWKVGLCIGIGALFKWPIYILWLFITPFSWDRKKELFFSIALSSIGLLPTLFWNATHEWATFRHVWYSVLPPPSAVAATATVVTKPLFNGNPFEFFAAQIGLLSPVYFFLFLFALIHIVKKRKAIPFPIFFCALISSCSLLFSLFLACFNKMQANWGIYIYPTAVLLLCWYAVTELRYGKRWLFFGTALSLFLSSIVISLPSIQSNSYFSQVKIPYKINMFRHNLGWDALHTALREIQYDAEEHFLFSHKYQMTSILSFYGPGQKRAYFLNIKGNRKNQFSFWPSMKEEQQGKTGFFVVAENRPHCNAEEYIQELSPYFEKVELALQRPIFYAYTAPQKSVLILKCHNYNGTLPTPLTTRY